jgi:hypothetical protein
MDPQKRFLASTLQGAIDAEVLGVEDLYRHLPAEILAEHIPSEILWTVLTSGMKAAGLGFGAKGAPRPAVPQPPTPAIPAPPEPEPEPEPESEPEPEPEPEPEVNGVPQAADTLPESEAEVAADLDAIFDEATDGAASEGGDLPFEVSDDDDLLEIDDDDGLVVEDVDWDDDEK